MKIAFAVEYDGAGFSGWQRQRNARRTVQQELESALSHVADHPVQLFAAGRTDTGVHALWQVVHMETSAPRDQRAWLFGGNTLLPRDIALRGCYYVPDEFHARFSALSRTYRYVIVNHRLRPALARHRCAWEPRPLDHAAMHSAGQALLGEHDFSAFRAAGCQARSPIRTVSDLRVTRDGDLVELAVTANAFLHNMVRIVAGTLLEVGRGERHAGQLAELLDAGDRRATGVTAPPQGLYFAGVEYAPGFGVPRTADGVDSAFLIR